MASDVKGTMMTRARAGHVKPAALVALSAAMTCAAAWTWPGPAGACPHHDGPEPTGPRRMDGRSYEITIEAGINDRTDRVRFGDGALDSFLLRRLGYVAGAYVIEEQPEGWTLTAEVSAPSGNRALWQANVQEDGIEGTITWKESAGAATPDVEAFMGRLLPPLHERLGGHDAIAAIVGEFVDLAWGPLSTPALKDAVTAELCAASDASSTLAHSALAAHHPGWDNTMAAFNRVALSHGIPPAEREELTAILDSIRREALAAP